MDAEQRRARSRERSRRWHRRHPERTLLRQHNWKATHPEAYAAHKVVVVAIRNGMLVRRPCEICGAENARAHHEDYSKPLDVRWLCQIHHVARHRELEMQQVGPSHLNAPVSIRITKGPVTKVG